MQGLGFLKGSHSPHYDREPGRRPLYQKLVGSGEMKPGYACDNDAGIYFEDNEVKRVVATRDGAKVYYVSRVNGKAVERVMEPGGFRRRYSPGLRPGLRSTRPRRPGL